MFLTLMVMGLVGLLMMALPAFGRHGHGHAVGRGVVRGHALGTARAGAALARGGAAAAGAKSQLLAAAPASRNLLRFVPSPRAVCSVLALYGAVGNALVHAAHLEFALAAIVALGPALLIEWVAVRPIWNLLFRFQGQPSSPLGDVVLAEATAVVPFRNGRGVVSVVRDGRLVQLAARLPPEQASVIVKVGDRLRIEDVDAERERVTVTVLSGTDQLPR